jgi:hypothetical protein
MNYSTTGRLFSGPSSINFFEERRQNIINTIVAKNENEILNISVEQYSEYLYSVYFLEYPSLDENYTISSYETDIPSSRFPPEFGISDRVKSIRRNIIVFHLLFDGEVSLLDIRPSVYSLSAVPSITLKSKEFQFEYINFYDNSEMIKAMFENDFRSFKHSFYSLKSDFEKFNLDLKNFIRNNICKRRDQLLKNNNFLASFNVPLKSNTGVSKTFSIPSPKLKEKIVISKPKVSNSNFVPEPTLDYDNYQKILKIINDVGINFERMPSVYNNKNEEDLRDYILMVLDPNFELGSASGETFNKKGKTDILLRYDSSVVFVAECKFWSGEKILHKTIDQLLGYLTWRDSKTAIILFVSNKEISSVIQKIKETISDHACYISTKGQKAENWSEHVFHLPIDANKEVSLSILAFHLPEIQNK